MTSGYQPLSAVIESVQEEQQQERTGEFGRGWSSFVPVRTITGLAFDNLDMCLVDLHDRSGMVKSHPQIEYTDHVYNILVKDFARLSTINLHGSTNLWGWKIGVHGSRHAGPRTTCPVMCCVAILFNYDKFN